MQSKDFCETVDRVLTVYVRRDSEMIAKALPSHKHREGEEREDRKTRKGKKKFINFCELNAMNIRRDVCLFAAASSYKTKSSEL